MLLSACGGSGTHESPTAILSVACEGPACGASSPGQYARSGVGVWTYANTGPNAVALDIDIAGLTQGQTITLVFSNGDSEANWPELGSEAAATRAALYEPANTSSSTLSTGQDVAHRSILERRRQRTQQPLRPNTGLALPSRALPSSPPAIGDQKDWYVLTGARLEQMQTRTAIHRSACALDSKRQLLFWQDTQDHALTDDILKSFVSAVCPSGKKGFDRLTGLLGDFWGPHKDSTLIADGLTPQPVNIVFVQDNDSAANWAGYFLSDNNSLVASNSNQALVFFINTQQLGKDVPFFVSTLVHEATHMVSYYQNTVLRGKNVETWFEETAAMMSEDIFAPSLTGFNKMAQVRLPDYLASGAGFSLTQWQFLTSKSYAMGGSLAAFLNRRHGPQLLAQSVAQCTQGSALNDSYACLDGLIVAAGGAGLPDELARMGASLFSRMPPVGSPPGYGFPARVVDEDSTHTLEAIDLSMTPMASPSKLSDLLGPMAQTYFNSPVTGQRYRRNGVVVPAGVRLHVVVQ